MSRVPSTVRSGTPCGSILICRGTPEFPREQEELDDVLQNLASEEIASKLNVSVRTVKFHVPSLPAKVGVTNRITFSREVSTYHSATARKNLLLFAREPTPSCSASPGRLRMQIASLPGGCRRGRPLPAPAAFVKTGSRTGRREPPVSSRPRSYGETAPRSKSSPRQAASPG